MTSPATPSKSPAPHPAASSEANRDSAGGTSRLPSARADRLEARRKARAECSRLLAELIVARAPSTPDAEESRRERSSPAD